eukprot:gene777-5313_t
MVKSAALALVMAGAAASASAVPPPLTFTFDTTALKVWFNHTDSCGDSDAPDQSLAAFRRADGLVMGYSGDNSPGGFFASYGASLFGLKRNCTLPVITGSTCHACNLDPAVFPHDVWLMATWSADGGDVVHALVHDEFHANITDNVTCPSGSHTDCWYTTILAATSTDGGRTFEYARTPSNPRAIALSGPTGYRPAKVGSLNARPQGYPNHHLVHDPRDDYLYLHVGCGVDAHLPSDTYPEGGQTVTSADPYASPSTSSVTDTINKQGHLPAVVSSGLPGSGSITYMEGSELFVVMGTHLQPVKGARPVVQVNYKISDNMVEWSDTYSVEPFFGCATYPHLLDVHSPSRNFDHIGANSTEVYMQFNTGMPGEGISRAGIAVKVTIAQNTLAAATSAETAAETAAQHTR